MKIYFTARQLPGLENLSTTERLQVLASINHRFSKPEKLFLNILKLLLIIPVFVLFTGQYDVQIVLAGLAICAALYPAVLRPTHLGISAKYVEQSISAHAAKSSQVEDEEDEEG